MELQPVRFVRRGYWPQLALLAEVNESLRQVEDWSEQYVSASRGNLAGARAMILPSLTDSIDQLRLRLDRRSFDVQIRQ